MNIKLTAAQLRRLADIKDEIAALASEFDTIATTGTPVSMPPPSSVHRGGQWTPARRKKYAKTISQRQEETPFGAMGARRPMSKATKAKLSAAAKKRWKKVWAAGESKL